MTPSTSGIASFGAYVPATRLPFALMAGRPAKDGGPEKAIAAHDEDSVTMAVAAAADALRGFDRASVDALFFGTTTHPFREKQGAALIAKALDLRSDIRTADVSSSLRAGTGALRAALDAVAAGSARRALAIASDARLAAPGSELEREIGDGAAAFLVSDTDVIAGVEAAFAVADEIVDVWRAEGDRFVHAWESRFVLQEGYTPRIQDAVQGALRSAGARISDVARVALYAPDARSHKNVSGALGLKPEQLQAPLFGKLGNAGAAFAPLLLVAALEAARPAERLLVASYGDGAEALILRTTDRIEKLGARRGVGWHMAQRRALRSYDTYLRGRALHTPEHEPPRDAGLSATIHFRERDADIAFRGQRCRRCGAEQFPPQRLCETCFAKDGFDPVRLSDRTGRVVTYTLDYFFPTPQPPTLVTVTEMDGGARVHLQLAEASADELRVGLRIEPSFRRMHESGGRPNYYWKAIPAGGEPEPRR